MTPQALRKDERYSYADYLQWDEGRWEIIDGEVFEMTPAPRPVHQEILGELHFILKKALQGNPCKIYLAPFDVRLAPHSDAADHDVFTVVQPDIVVVCDEKKLDDRGCLGAPDFVVEILSPSTATRDLRTKRDLYERFGVAEYLLIHPTDQMAMLYRLNEQGSYDKAEIFGRDEQLTLTTFAELTIALAELFASEQPV